jgi:hypothetical protein
MGKPSANVKLDTGVFLKVAENLKQVVGVRVALWPKHADQAFRRSTDTLVERRKTNRRLDLVAKDGLAGFHVTGEHAIARKWPK